MQRASVFTAAAIGVVLVSVLIDMSAAPAAQSHITRPLPDPESFFTMTRENMARANQEQNKYAYKERRTELHMNPFGRIGSGAISVYEVTPSSGGTVMHRKLLERDGKPVADARTERQERRPRRERRSIVDDAAAVLRFTIDGREMIQGRDVLIVRFEPRPDARPQTREGRIARVFKGTVWVDEAAREVVRAEAIAIDDISFGFGFIARLNKGTVVSVTRERVDDRIWLPTSIRFMGEGRAMLLRRLTLDHVIEWFDYRRTE